MSTNLHELTKQLDALTYNSRSVLNALIRSVMAAGSSTGWKVDRAGQTVEMTRSDIFMLSSFYTEWEYTRFDVEQFDTILAKLDAQYYGKSGMSSDTPVTDAVVKHSKIMSMTSEDVSVTDPSYWVDKVKNQVNPKLFTNTAPIPINIRTPIYDENLSTKHFDQFETYLFPRGYYSMDVLGYSGDNASHIGGGRDWFFDVDDKFIVNAGRAVVGLQDREVAERREENYSSGRLWSLAGGVDSYAFDQGSFAYGYGNQVSSSAGAAVGGFQNFVYGYTGGIVGGYTNNEVGTGGMVGGGRSNAVVGDNGFAANEGNSVGGFPFYFRRYVKEPSAGAETECAPSIPGDAGCVYVLQQTGSSANGADPEGVIAPNQVLITNLELATSGYGRTRNRITSGYDGAPRGYADFKVGDRVKIFRTTVVGQKGTANIGRAITRTVTDLEMRSYGLVVSFDSAVNRIPGFSGEVSAGYMARSSAVEVPRVGPLGVFVDMHRVDSSASVALGYNTVAGGSHQTVVGNSNYELMRPLFIVGNGSSYVNYDTTRNNAMVVADSYSYMATNTNYVFFGISNFSTASQYVHGESSSSTYNKYDEDYINRGIEKYRGVYAYSLDSDRDNKTRAVLRVHTGYTFLGIGDSGLLAHPISTERHPNSHRILAELYSKEGGVAMHAGSGRSDVSEEITMENSWKVFQSEWISTGAKNDYSVTMWAKDRVGIHGTGGIRLHTTNYLNANYGRLTLLGNSFGALTASTHSNMGIMDYPMGSRDFPQNSSYIKHPGHYFMRKDSSTHMVRGENSSYVNAYHVLNSSQYIRYSIEDEAFVWSTAELVIPAMVTCGENQHKGGKVPRVMVQTRLVNFYKDIHKNPQRADTNYIAEELAYLTDVQKVDGQYRGKSPETLDATKKFQRLCILQFSDLDAVYAGAEFSVTWKNSVSGCNGQGVLAFSLSSEGSDSIVGRISVMSRRESSAPDTSEWNHLKLYVEKLSMFSCAIWSESADADSIVSSLKLIGGNVSSITYGDSAQFFAGPDSKTRLPWQILQSTAYNLFS